MELDIKTNITNDLVVFNNYETVKQQVLEFVKKYDNLIVSEEAIDIATKDRALLNKVAKAMNDKRIAIEKSFKEQFEPFKNQVNSLIEPIKTASDNIDKQIKVFEDKQKQEKYNTIKTYFESVIDNLKDLISFDLIYCDKWMNKGFSIENIQDLINDKIKFIKTDFKVIEDLKTDKETVLKDFYLNNNFDLSSTLQEKTRLEEREKQLKELEEKKKKEEQERLAREEEQNQETMLKLAEEFKQKSLEEKYNLEKQVEIKQEEDGLTFLDKAINEKQEEQNKQEEVKTQPKLYKCSFEVVDSKEKLQLLKEFLINNNINYKRL